MDARIARLQACPSTLTAPQFRDLLEAWLAEFETDWTSRQREDPEGYPPNLPLEEWWDDFSEAVLSRTLSSER